MARVIQKIHPIRVIQVLFQPSERILSRLSSPYFEMNERGAFIIEAALAQCCAGKNMLAGMDACTRKISIDRMQSSRMLKNDNRSVTRQRGNQRDFAFGGRTNRRALRGGNIDAQVH